VAGAATGLAAANAIRPLAATAAPAPAEAVAIRMCKHYDRTLLHAKLGLMFSDLGGLSSLVAGKSVAIKINGTGTGLYHQSLHSKMAHTTHPDVVYAAVRRFLEAGATTIHIMESWPSTSDDNMVALMGFNKAEYEALGDGTQVRFYNTRNKALDTANPDTGYSAYSRINVADGPGTGTGYLFDYFYVNKMWTPPKADVVVSIAKLKGHETCGVTLGIKNMFGCLPNSIYGGDSRDTRPNENAVSTRGNACHNGDWNGAGKPLLGEIPGVDVSNFGPERMPCLLADLVRARPIHLTIIDGITATQGAWGPTRECTTTTPGVLVAGFNPVCTDAVCVGIMGQDPRAPKETGMFPSGFNHIDLAAAKGVGANDLSLIPVIGDPIEKVRYDYYPMLNFAADNPRYL
jgi:uncharacterized protein (DUF362 family)